MTTYNKPYSAIKFHSQFNSMTAKDIKKYFIDLGFFAPLNFYSITVNSYDVQLGIVANKDELDIVFDDESDNYFMLLEYIKDIRVVSSEWILDIYFRENGKVDFTCYLRYSANLDNFDPWLEYDLNTDLVYYPQTDGAGMLTQDWITLDEFNNQPN